MYVTYVCVIARVYICVKGLRRIVRERARFVCRA